MRFLHPPSATFEMANILVNRRTIDMKNLLRTASMAVMLPVCAAAQTIAAQQDQVVHINQIQVIGSHNSYHTGFAPSERKLTEQQNPKVMQSFDYAHPPLGDQL